MTSGVGVSGECADHCHSAKKARGLLCATCNKVLGAYEKYQRPAGLLIAPYEQYLAMPPVTILETDTQIFVAPDTLIP